MLVYLKSMLFMLKIFIWFSGFFSLSSQQVTGSDIPKPEIRFSDHMNGIFEMLENVKVQNSNSTWNVFQEMRHFLILTDLVIISIYLKNSQPRFKKQMFFWSENIRHRASRFTKIK